MAEESKQTKLMKDKYGVIHEYSPDCRGVCSKAEPAPDPQEPPQRLEGDCSCDGDRRCIEHLFQERADAKARKDGNQ